MLEGLREDLDSVHTPSYFLGGEPEWVIRAIWTNKVYFFCFKQTGQDLKVSQENAKSVDLFTPGSTGWRMGFYQAGVSQHLLGHQAMGQIP